MDIIGLQLTSCLCDFVPRSIRISMSFSRMGVHRRKTPSPTQRFQGIGGKGRERHGSVSGWQLFRCWPVARKCKSITATPMQFHDAESETGHFGMRTCVLSDGTAAEGLLEWLSRIRLVLHIPAVMGLNFQILTYAQGRWNDPIAL